MAIVTASGFKYNPGFADDDELRRNFIVRNRELRLLLKILEENIMASNNRHILLIGPRGAGKTTLARRVAAELRADPKLSAHWLPVSFGEESYKVTSTGEFWLEAIYHLQAAVHSDQLGMRYEALRRIDDEQALLDTALEVIIEYARTTGKRLVLIVENLNSLLEGQMSRDDAWSFRHALQSHPEIMLFATATASFEQIERDELALFEQFKVHLVGPLSASDCRRLWSAIAKEPLRDEQVRPIQILTGGNPRLIRILAEFALNNVFADLVNNLSRMIDQYTDYFKGQLDLLPTSERKIFVSLLEHWDPALTAEIAEVARMNVSQTSANLSRLERRGAIVKEGRHWQAAERLFNIYYLMRRRGTPSSRVQALVKFMTVYYGPDQLVKRINELAHQACGLKPSDRQDHYYAISSLMTQFAPGEQRQALAQIPMAFFQDPNLPPPIVRLQAMLTDTNDAAARSTSDGARSDRVSQSQLRRAVVKHLVEDRLDAAKQALEALREKTGDSPDTLAITALYLAQRGDAAAAEATCHKVLAKDPEHAGTWMALISLLLRVGRHNDALVAARRLTDLVPDRASAWELLALASLEGGLDDREARKAFERALEINPKSVAALVGLADLAIGRGESELADHLFKRAVKVTPADVRAYGGYTDFLENAGRLAETERLYRRMTKKFPEDSRVWTRFAIFVHTNTERVEEARELFAKATELAGDAAGPWVAAAEFYDNNGDEDGARAAWRRALELDPESSELWHLFGRFAERQNLIDEAERAFLHAIELSPSSSKPWESLGSLLAVRADRHREAENAFQEAIRNAPESCSAIHSLGEFFEKQGRIEEADAQFRKALNVQPGCGCALERLISERTRYGDSIPGIEAMINGLVVAHPENARARWLRSQYLRRARGDIVGARAELQIALSLKQGVTAVWRELAELLFESAPADRPPAEALLELIAENNPCVHILNSVAWSLRKLPDPRARSAAVAVAQLAFNKLPDNWGIRHTLAHALLDDRHFPEAISHLCPLVETHEEEDFSELLDILIAYLQMANGREALILREIEHANRAEAIEPVIVALKLKLGQKVYVATEVIEVARDIIERVEGRVSTERIEPVS